jgi:hypothetical protein
MKRFGNHLWLSFFAAMIFACGCSTKDSTPADDSKAFASPGLLTAALTKGNIILHWQNNATADGGNWVEFATPGSDYTKLGVFMSETNVTSFLHPRVAPRTTFIYHIQPFFGRATKPVEITTGISTNNAPMLDEGPIASSNGTFSGANATKVSIRTMQTFATAAPTDLTATLSSPTSVDLHWKSRASDEDGYLLEIGPGDGGKFQICALLSPGTTSFRKIGLLSQTKYSFRVRAFFNGKPSGTASITTP